MSETLYTPIKNNLLGEIEEETKICGMCLNSLPIHMFAKEGSKGYLRYECRNCAKKHEKLVARIKKYAPKIPVDHKCPICQRTVEQLATYGKNKKSPWVADHNHKTEQFRGWLCQKCNLGLGNFNDDVDRLIRAKLYLENRNEQSLSDTLEEFLK